MSDEDKQAVKSRLAEERRADVYMRLMDSIGLARLAPEQRIIIESLALHLRASLDDVMAVLPSVVQSGLISVHETEVAIAGLDHAALFAKLDEREVLEKQIAAAAAANISAEQKTALEAAVVMLKRSALVGDIEGYMNADKALEKIIGQSSGLETSFEKLVHIKREFRRAWCAHNRLRDLNVPAAMREALTKSIINGTADQAVLNVEIFMKYIRTCL